MPQELLPMFSPNEVMITEFLSYEKRNGSIYYFQSGLPIFNHSENDKASFRMFTSQLIINGNCKQVDIVKAFGISAISVKRWVKLYRQEGVKGFYKPRTPRGAHVLKPDILEQAQRYLDEGMNRFEVARHFNIKPDTLYRAIKKGKLREPVKKTAK